MSGTPTLLLICFLSLIGLLFFVGMALGGYRDYMTKHSDNQSEFLTGTIPDVLPDGLYKGTVDATTNWKGKQFDSSNQTGINVFDENGESVEKYPFTTSIGKGLADPGIDVIKIDYNLPQNPLWLRFVLDEIVFTESGKYLGKLHMKVGPLHYALGFFTLER